MINVGETPFSLCTKIQCFLFFIIYLYLFIMKSRLFHSGVRLDGANVEFVIW